MFVCSQETLLNYNQADLTKNNHQQCVDPWINFLAVSLYLRRCLLFCFGFFLCSPFFFFFFFHPLKGRNISLIHFFFDRVWALDLKCLSNLNLAPLMLVTIFLSANQLTFAKRSVILIDVPLVLTAFFYFIFLLFLSF